MRVNRTNSLLRTSGLILLSAAIVATISSLDSLRQKRNQTHFALRWARQMTAQAESLSLTAAEKGEVDPLAWAARLLTQGTDSRILFVSKLHTDDFDPSSSAPVEVYELDPSTGIFDYSKIIYPQDGMGIKIRLYTARAGFFGARTLLGQDLTFLALFTFIFGFLKLSLDATAWRKQGQQASSAPSQRSAPPPPPEMNPLKPVVQEWISQSKNALMELGIHIRELTRSAQKITSSAVDSKQHVEALRERLHANLTDLHSCRRDTDEIGDLAAEADHLFSSMDAKAQALIRKLLDVSVKNAESATQLEIQLESVVIDCDQAFHALKEVSGSAQVMSSEIKHTTQGILSQSKLMAELKKKSA
jgi:hypothetical protein